MKNLFYPEVHKFESLINILLQADDRSFIQDYGSNLLIENYDLGSGRVTVHSGYDFSAMTDADITDFIIDAHQDPVDLSRYEKFKI